MITWHTFFWSILQVYPAVLLCYSVRRAIHTFLLKLPHRNYVVLYHGDLLLYINADKCCLNKSSSVHHPGVLCTSCRSGGDGPQRLIVHYTVCSLEISLFRYHFKAKLQVSYATHAVFPSFWGPLSCLCTFDRV